MPLTDTERQMLDTTGQVVIETRVGGRSMGTIIWVVVDDGEVFVRSVRGESGRWYQRVLADPDVALVVGETRLRFRAVPAADAESVDRASEGLRRKYTRGRSLDSMLRPEVLGTTLLLEPIS